VSSTSLPQIQPAISKMSSLDQITLNISRYWILIFGIFFGIYVWLPFLAPVFMQLGWNGAGRAIYLIYSFLCHQLPERSWFLFGHKASYSLAEIQAAGQNTTNPLILRQFIGNPQMGWKIAWSDRMVSMFGSIWLFGILWWPLRHRIKPIPWWGALLFVLPMSVDGATHLISDLFGIGGGFRDINLWLVNLTHNAFPPGFYAGDALGSFNSWMRLITGILFGLGIVWFGFPSIHNVFQDTVIQIESKQKYIHYLINLQKDKTQ
jgi:uncharacterized membrane protein